VKQIAQRFSWGLSPSPNLSQQSKRPRSPVPDQEDPRNKRSRQESQDANVTAAPKGLSIRFPQSVLDQEQTRPSVEKKQQLARSNTFGSVRDRPVSQKLRRRETEIEQDIKKKLNTIYPGGGELYYRLAPDVAPHGTARNDSSAPGLTLDATLKFLKLAIIENRIDEIVQRMPDVIVTA
jgi:hypothetical protein